MNKRLIGLPLAGLLVVGGATAVLARSENGAGAVETATRAAGGVIEGTGSLLEDVLADLVADGTIEGGQADAIHDAVETRHAELREQARASREQLRSYLEDGTISADELAELPEDHPLRNLDQLLEDGELTVDELRSLRGFGFGRGHGHGGPGLHGPRADDRAGDSEDPSTEQSRSAPEASAPTD